MLYILIYESVFNVYYHIQSTYTIDAIALHRQVHKKNNCSYEMIAKRHCIK